MSWVISALQTTGKYTANMVDNKNDEEVDTGHVNDDNDDDRDNGGSDSLELLKYKSIVVIGLRTLNYT